MALPVALTTGWAGIVPGLEVWHFYVACVAVVVAYVVTPLRPRRGYRSRPPVFPEGYDDNGDAIDRSEDEVPKGLDLAPSSTPTQRRAAIRWHKELGGVADAAPPRNCVVTGGTGFVGQRLVEMLVERGAKRVVSFDVVPKPESAWDHPAIEWVRGDITDMDAVREAVKGADCVWHNAAAVGPFHPMELYDKVNHIGTLNVIDACRAEGVPKIVMSSSPSTRFDGTDVDGLTEDDMPSLPMKSYMQAYAASKAAGELALRNACTDDLMTVAVAPHQVYGPKDNLFMPNILEAAGTGRLRVFADARTGYGMIRVCFTYVDNYAHGLITAATALYKGSPALGKFYIVTDGGTHPFAEGYAHFWEAVDQVIVAMGFTSIWAKVKLPTWLLLPLSYLSFALRKLTGITMKLQPFNVKVLTMHRWFRIKAAEEELGYEPVVPFDEGLADTARWFAANWLPGFLARSGQGLGGIARQSQRKIDIQEESALGTRGGKARSE